MMHRVCSGILVIVLGVAVATPARADALQSDARNIVIGIVLVTAAVAVLLTVLVLRHTGSAKGSITGCVQSDANGMSVTDEKNGLKYALSGSTTGVKPGDRVTLKGKRKDIGTTVGFAARRVSRDFGACQP